MTITKTIRAIKFDTVEEALADHEKITGSKMFECYEHILPQKLKIINSILVKEHGWMVDDIGEIYFVVQDPEDGSKHLNQLALNSCIDDSNMVRICMTRVFENVLIHYTDIEFKKCKEARKFIAKNNMIVA